MDPRVRIASDAIFSKTASNAFSNPALEIWLRRNLVGRIVIVGVFAHACVCQTVRGALNRGYSVVVVREAVGGKSERSRDDAVAGLRKRGAVVASLDEVSPFFARAAV
jgi:nicotinamidase-related amidase